MASASTNGRRNGPQPPLVDVIRDAIRQRLLPPGMPLVQSALADALGVSRIPVREALHYLASEGLVTFTEEGASVTSLTTKEIHELWSLRALIESSMAEEIVRNIAPFDLDDFERLVEAMEAAADDNEWSDLNYAFHARLHRVARLPHFANVAARVLTQIEPYSRVAASRPRGRADAQHEHHEIIAALRDRDGAGLASVLERHSVRARDMLVELAEGRQEVSVGSQESEAARAFASRLLAGKPDSA
jgi:DNA-binding GntR family transcriptional regulator